jgi:hypothetical protein
MRPRLDSQDSHHLHFSPRPLSLPHAALLNTLLALTPEQLDALAPVEKAQALAIINMFKKPA